MANHKRSTVSAEQCSVGPMHPGPERRGANEIRHVTFCIATDSMYMHHQHRSKPTPLPCSLRSSTTLGSKYPSYSRMLPNACLQHRFSLCTSYLCTPHSPALPQVPVQETWNAAKTLHAAPLPRHRKSPIKTHFCQIQFNSITPLAPQQITHRLPSSEAGKPVRFFFLGLPLFGGQNKEQRNQKRDNKEEEETPPIVPVSPSFFNNSPPFSSSLSPLRSRYSALYTYRHLQNCYYYKVSQKH